MTSVDYHYRSAHGVVVLLRLPEGFKVPPRILTHFESQPVMFELSAEKPARKKPAADRRGTRITADFAPTDELLKWAAEFAPSVNPRSETAKFIDYWAGRAGQGSAKLDWQGTWRNWLRETHERNVSRGWKPSARTQRAAETATPESARDKWLRQRGISLAEFERKKHDSEWVERIKRRGITNA